MCRLRHISPGIGRAITSFVVIEEMTRSYHCAICIEFREAGLEVQRRRPQLRFRVDRLADPEIREAY